MAIKKRTDERRISEMRNLGSACERDLNAVGINTAQPLIDLGAESAFTLMLQGRQQRGRSATGCHATYLYALYGAIHDIDWRELPQRKQDEFKGLTAEMRQSGRFK